jgi:putative phosphotransacetylase
LDILYGEGHELTPKKMLVQPGQYAAEEQVSIVGPKVTMENVRVLGPLRPYTQLEISYSDARTLGIRDVPLRLSGDLDNTPGFTIIGPKGRVVKDQGMIVAQRHIHLSREEGEAYNIKDGDIVSVRIKGPRGLVLNNVLCRVGETHKMEMHIDIEEGNAAGAKNNQLALIIDREMEEKMTMAELLEVFNQPPMLGDIPLSEEQEI